MYRLQLDAHGRHARRRTLGDRRTARRGFTLLEALMAAGVLLAIVVAVSSAITAGQQNAYEAHQRIAGTLASEELMGRLLTEPYANLPTWDGFTEAPGEMVDMSANPMPGSFGMVGREVRVTTGMRAIENLDVRVRGRTVRVRSFNADDRTLAELQTFIPEPQS